MVIYFCYINNIIFPFVLKHTSQKISSVVSIIERVALSIISFEKGVRDVIIFSIGSSKDLPNNSLRYNKKLPKIILE